MQSIYLENALKFVRPVLKSVKSMPNTGWNIVGGAPRPAVNVQRHVCIWLMLKGSGKEERPSFPFIFRYCKRGFLDFGHINIKGDENFITTFIKYLILLCRMKKVIVAILAILYMGSTTGATIHMHYCMGKLVDKGLWHNKASKCKLCNKQEKKKACTKDCCKDQHKFVKVEKDQKAGETSFQYVHPAAAVNPHHYTVFASERIIKLAQQYPVCNAPPLGNVHFYILNCTFLI